jgi:two-component system phosphate regulon response regulator PhoB
MPARILVVEDEPAIRALIDMNLRHRAYHVVSVDNTLAAAAAVAQELPDLILLDWMLPGASGIDFARQLRTHTRTQGIPIIMLTARSGEEDKIAGLESGADDYVTKPFSVRELAARIEAVLRRRLPQAAKATISAQGLTLNPETGVASAHGQVLPIDPVEFRLLHFLMTHPGRVLSRPVLLDGVWGDHVFIEERTVDVHILRLRRALKVAQLDHLIATLRGRGYGFNLSASPTP